MNYLLLSLDYFKKKTNTSSTNCLSHLSISLSSQFVLVPRPQRASARILPPRTSCAEQRAASTRNRPLTERDRPNQRTAHHHQQRHLLAKLLLQPPRQPLQVQTHLQQQQRRQAQPEVHNKAFCSSGPIAMVRFIWSDFM